MADTPPAVEIKNLVKDFKTSFRRKPLRAVNDVTIRIAPGEVYGFSRALRGAREGGTGKGEIVG